MYYKDDSWQHYSKRDMKGHILYDSIYVKCSEQGNKVVTVNPGERK
jgi:hypothetical protein